MKNGIDNSRNGYSAAASHEALLKPLRSARFAFLFLPYLFAHSMFANNPGGGDGTGPDVTLTDRGSTVVLENGIIQLTVNKSTAKVQSMLFRGFEVVSNTDPRNNTIYFSMDGGTTYQVPSNCAYSVTSQTPDMVDVSFKHTYASGDPHALDIDVHFVLRRGSTGVYAYPILSHPAAYPAVTMGEWRMVWWLPHDATDFAFENIYVDGLRNWQGPSFFDIQHSSPTPIQEIVLLNTGVRAGHYFSKYEYSAEYRAIGTWGHASNTNGVGAWVVLGSFEFLNDGPVKQDLTIAEGYNLLHFGMDHYNSSSTNVAAGEDWSKFFGPYLLYCNSGADGADALWADAQAQASAEQIAWPYSWLTNSSYPSAGDRGQITGRFVVSDALRPSQTGGGAWVGVSQPDPGGNWQFESKRYQYWAKADDSGQFIIPNVRPGSYVLSAFVTGEVGEYTGAANVTAGNSTSVGVISWNIKHPGNSIAWEIGTPDRSAAEFRHGTNYFEGYLYKTFVNELSNPLDYTVGVSDWSTDWNYAQSALYQNDGTLAPWKWRIHFNLDRVPASGNATLTIAYASAQGAHMNLYVNDDTRLFMDLGGPAVSGGNALLRQGVHAKYALQYVSIPVSALKTGENIISLVQASAGGQDHHVMYDYLNLELP